MLKLKGQKRKPWLKVGYKISRKWYKKMWNKRVRHSKDLYNDCSYKKLAGPSMWDGIP